MTVSLHIERLVLDRRLPIAARSQGRIEPRSKRADASAR
jgi:hypothetical protein